MNPDTGGIRGDGFGRAGDRDRDQDVVNTDSRSGVRGGRERERKRDDGDEDGDGYAGSEYVVRDARPRRAASQREGGRRVAVRQRNEMDRGGRRVSAMQRRRSGGLEEGNGRVSCGNGRG